MPVLAQVRREEGSSLLLEERQDGLAALGAGQITAGCKCLSLAPRTVTSFSTPAAKVRLSDHDCKLTGAEG